MAQAMIYVYNEPRQVKAKSSLAFPFSYDGLDELIRQCFLYIDKPGTYYVTVFNGYGECLFDIYKSEKTKGVVK